MNKIRIITDSASDMPADYRSDVTVVPLHVRFGTEEYLDGVNLTHREFYEKLIENDELPTTSQVAPFAFEEQYEKAREAGEQVIVITISGKLSGTYQSACIASADYEDVVHVVDSENVTVGERTLVEYALRLKDDGKTVGEIVDILNEEKKNIRVIGLLDTLEYLKKGGRISKTVALVGGMLSIKPVIAIESGEVVMLGKARGSKQGNNLLVQQIEKAGGIDFSKPYFLGYAGLDDTLLRKYIADSAGLWEAHADKLDIMSVGGAIGTHVGPGAIAVAFFDKSNV